MAALATILRNVASGAAGYLAAPVLAILVTAIALRFFGGGRRGAGSIWPMPSALPGVRPPRAEAFDQGEQAEVGDVVADAFAFDVPDVEVGWVHAAVGRQARRGRGPRQRNQQFLADIAGKRYKSIF